MRRKILHFTIFIIGCIVAPLSIQAQTIIASDGFNTPSQWTLNQVEAAPVNAVVPSTNTLFGVLPDEDNRWLLNNSYQGGTFAVGGLLSATVPNTPAQPAGIANPNGNYLHITSAAAIAGGVLNANFNGSLDIKRRFFAKMNYDFSTTGYIGLQFSYWHTGSAGQSVYYSTNSGTSWTLLEAIPSSGNTAWVKRSLANPALDNQATLRFGFLFDDQVATNALSPLGNPIGGYPAVDQIELSTPPINVAFSADRIKICKDSTLNFFNQSTPATGVQYTWSITPNTFTFVGGTNASSQAPKVTFQTAGNYSVTLTVKYVGTGSINGQQQALTRTNYVEVIEGACFCESGATTSFLLDETFDGASALPTGWAIADLSANGTTWRFNDCRLSCPQGPGNISGNEMYFTGVPFQVQNGDISRLLTPTMNMTAAGTYTLSYRYINPTNSGTTNILRVYLVGPNLAGSPVLLATHNNTPNWTTNTITLNGVGNANANNIRVRFEAQISVFLGLLTGFAVGVDDVTVQYTGSGNGGAGNTLPNVTIASTPNINEVCIGQPLTFTATGNNITAGATASYEWFVNNVSQGAASPSNTTFNLNTATPGTYEVRAEMTQAGVACTGPFVSSIRTITVTAAPTPLAKLSASPSGGVCAGTPVIFRTSLLQNAGATPTFQWERASAASPNTFTAIVGATLDSLVANTGSLILNNGDRIRLRVTSSLSCAAPQQVFSDTFTVNIIPPSTLANAITGANQVCPGSSAVYKIGSGSTNKIWSIANGNGTITSFSGTTDSISVAWGTSVTTDTILVIDRIGTCAQKTVKLPVSLSRPTPPTTTNGIACGANGVATLTASGVPVGGRYRWYTSPTGTDTLALSTSTFVTDSLTTYYVSIVVDGCESERTSVNRNVSAIPNQPNVVDSAICGEGTVVLIAVGFAPHYRWYNTATGSDTVVGVLNTPTGIGGIVITSYSPFLTASDTFYISAVNAAGCESARTPIIATIHPLPAVPTLVSDTSICGSQSIDITASGAIAGQVYEWQDVNGAVVGNSATFTTPTVTASTTFFVSIKDTTTGCESEQQGAVNVTLNPIPAVPTFTLSNDTIFCDGDSLVITTTSPNTVWSTGATTNSIIVKQAGTYYARAFTAAGCISDTSAKINVTITPVPATPSITAIGATTFCDGGSVTLTAPAGFSYVWNNDNTVTNQSITVNQSGTYTVQVIQNGCISSASDAVSVVVHANPTVTATASAATVTIGDEVTLTGAGAQNYAWSSNGNSVGTTSVVTLKPEETATYLVTGTDVNGCIGTASVVVEVFKKFHISNAFTPNGDNINDTWEIEGLEVVGTVEVVIFNRWGQKVYESSNYQNSWKGDDLPSGTYFYQLKTSSQSYAGSVQILR